jgi:8-oxo-dGTP pyrophosphatase MutT (NUDIX family)
MRWLVHGERSLYECEWLRLVLTDVEIPDGERFEHHVVRIPNHAAGTVVSDPERGVLLLWRHRFITDTWGYEIPAGRIEPGETPDEAAVRETVEETGWRPTGLRPLVRYQPINGVCDQVFHVFVAGSASRVGEPVDRAEAERIEWVPMERVRRLVEEGQVLDGMSLTALCYTLAFGPTPPDGTHAQGASPDRDSPDGDRGR